MTHMQPHRRASCVLTIAAAALFTPAAALAQSYDLRFDWSNTLNPAAPWSYREGPRLLPHIGNWDPFSSTRWTTPQPGWSLAPSPGSLNGGGGSTPFIFKSNGTETFPHDWLAGDIIIRTRDAADGSGNGAPCNCPGGPGGPGTGNGHAGVVWTSPLDGMVTLIGTLWPARSPNIVHVASLTQNGESLWQYAIFPSSTLNRDFPGIFDVMNQSTLRGDSFEFTFQNLSSNGQGAFFGVNLNIIVCIGIIQPPQHALICPGGTTSVSVQARTSYGTINYRWRKDGVPLLEGGAGGRYHGVFGPTLSITNMTSAQGGMYDCVVGSVCSTLASDAAPVTFCRADFNCSGTLTIADLFDYLGAWFAADPHADFDTAPGLSMNDIVEYVNTWFAGCN